MLDTYTRTELWVHGLDYGHGTGHGVGHYLCVHEGPQGISSRHYEPILLGSVTTNEPGMYLEGRFGIRTENIMICKIKEETEFGEFCEFETVTMCPIDRKLINPGLLSAPQLEWLNDYHAKVYASLAPLLEEHVSSWLEQQTQPIEG
jgi:Xaa-Pro aminopeptidase